MEYSQTSDAPVDFERLREVSDGDADFMNDLVGMYIEQTSEFLENLKTKIDEQDFDAVRGIAHKALGGSKTCGMNLIVPCLHELERMGESKNLENAEQVLEQAQSAYDEICDYLVSNRDKL